MVRFRRLTACLAVFLAVFATSLLLLPACSDSAPAGPAAPDPGSAASASFKDVSNVEQLQVSTTRHEYAEIGEETGNGGYGEYTEIALATDGYDGLKAALAALNDKAAKQTTEDVSNHANDPDAQATTDSHALDVLLGGVDRTVEATDFINYVSQSVITRADSGLTCVLETRVSELDGSGKQLYFATHAYDSATGEELALEDLVTDTSQLPALIDEALHEKYCFDNTFKEDENIAQIVSGKLENPEANGDLAWTADYLGMKFYFDSGDLSYAKTYHGMYVSIPYEAHPDLFAPVCQTVPDDFIAQLEYGKTYALPGDAQGRMVRVTRTHDDDARPQGLLGTSPNKSNATAGWTFATQVGTGEGDSFAPAGEAASMPWFYDMRNQDYMPCLVRSGGNWYVYGFGDRNSDNFKTTVFALEGDDGAPQLVTELSEGFESSCVYTRWALPCNPASVVMVDRDCIASYDRITFERQAAIDGETGLPTPEDASFRAHTVNQAYKMRTDVNGVLLDDAGNEGDAVAVPEGAVCYLESGKAHDHYDMRLEDGRLVRLAYDAKTRKVDGHYTNDVLAMVPAASAASANVEAGPLKRRVWHHGQYVTLVPETGNLVGVGATIEYGDTPWWVAEEYVGTWNMTEDDRALVADWYADGETPAEGSLEIREDGTFTFVFDGRAFEGQLDATRGWAVFAGGSMTPTDGGNSQEVSFDYTNDDDNTWSHLQFHAAGLPYPLSEQSPAIDCYLTRVNPS